MAKGAKEASFYQESANGAAIPMDLLRSQVEQVGGKKFSDGDWQQLIGNLHRNGDLGLHIGNEVKDMSPKMLKDSVMRDGTVLAYAYFPKDRLENLAHGKSTAIDKLKGSAPTSPAIPNAQQPVPPPKSTPVAQAVKEDPVPPTKPTTHRSGSADGFPPETEVRVAPKMSEADMKSLGAKMNSLPSKQKDALKAYTYGDYMDVNSSFHAGKPTHKAEAVQAAVKAANGLPKPMTVYRGIDFKTDKEKDQFIASIEQKIKTGGQFEHTGLASTSLSPAVAQGYGGGVIFEIKAKTGAYVRSISHYPEENEILQAHGTRYRPVNVLRNVPVKGHEDEGGAVGRNTVIQLEEI